MYSHNHIYPSPSNKFPFEFNCTKLYLYIPDITDQDISRFVIQT